MGCLKYFPIYKFRWIWAIRLDLFQDHLSQMIADLHLTNVGPRDISTNARNDFFSPRGRCSVHNCALRAGLRGPADNCLLSGFIGAAAAWPAAGTDHAHPDQHPCTCTSCTLATWWTNILAKTATLAPGCLPTSVATTQVAENQRCVMCWFHL